MPKNVEVEVSIDAELYLFAERANELVAELRERCAALERSLKGMSANCQWRAHGLCDLDCPGRAFCQVDGLNAFYWGRCENRKEGRSNACAG